MHVTYMYIEIQNYTCSDSCKSTALKYRAIGEKVPETELELRAYTLSRSFRATDPSRDPLSPITL